MDQKCKFPIIVFIISFFFLVHHRLSLSLTPKFQLCALSLSLSLSLSLRVCSDPKTKPPPKQVTVTKNKPLSLSLFLDCLVITILPLPFTATNFYFSSRNALALPPRHRRWCCPIQSIHQSLTSRESCFTHSPLSSSF